MIDRQISLQKIAHIFQRQIAKWSKFKSSIQILSWHVLTNGLVSVRPHLLLARQFNFHPLGNTIRGTSPKKSFGNLANMFLESQIIFYRNHIVGDLNKHHLEDTVTMKKLGMGESNSIGPKK